MAKFKELFNESENNDEIPPFAWKELSNYIINGKQFDTKILKYFSKYIPNKKVTAYLGVGCDKRDKKDLLKRFNIKNPVIGENITFTVKKFISLSINEKIAKNYSRMSISYFDDNDFLPIPNNFNIVIKILLSPKEIAIPIYFFPKHMKQFKYDDDEIIIKAGIYKGNIIYINKN